MLRPRPSGASPGQMIRRRMIEERNLLLLQSKEKDADSKRERGRVLVRSYHGSPRSVVEMAIKTISGR
jgi:hypothetical protein